MIEPIGGRSACGPPSEVIRSCFTSKTRDSSEYAYDYLSGQLRMETGRNFTQLGREADVSAQAIQHFMSNSPWSAQAVHRQVQDEIGQTPGLRVGGVLVLVSNQRGAFHDTKKRGQKQPGVGVFPKKP